MGHRLHVIALPHTQVTLDYSSCAYTEKVRKFCRMMDERNDVFLYAGEQSEALCTEHIVCITEKERKRALGRAHYTAGSFDASQPHWIRFNETAISELRKRVTPHDFLCVIGGHAHKPIADAFPNMMTVEFGIGYSGTFSKYKVYESYAWMHMMMGAGALNRDPTSVDGSFYDVVIPGYLELETFPEPEHSHFIRKSGKPYALYCGRMIDRKGLQVAVEACRAAKIKLVTCGPGKPVAGGFHKGELGPVARNKLMAEATCLLAPTLYIEPFGNVAIEAMACGTPVVSTDWGAFTETVISGRTGFRCHTLKEFADAINECPRLDRKFIRRHVLERYSLEAIGPQYQRHFDRLATLWGRGWYEGTPEIKPKAA